MTALTTNAQAKIRRPRRTLLWEKVLDAPDMATNTEANKSCKASSKGLYSTQAGIRP